MSNKEKISVCVIGAGIIGAGILKQKKYLKIVNSKLHHVGTLSKLNDFNLKCIIENNLKIQKILRSTYNCQVSNSLASLSDEQTFDLVSICVPDKKHYKFLNDVIKLKPKLVIIEKPISDNPDMSKEIINIYKKKKIKILVNYTRRFIPFYKDLANELMNQKIISCQVLYGNGIMHNGCHIIDLVKLLFGAIKSYKILSLVKDYGINDPTVSVFFNTQKCPSCFFIGLDNRRFTHWEMNIYTDKFHYKIYNDHRELLVNKVKNNMGIPPGKRLVFHKKKEINYDVAIRNLYLEARNIINNNSSWNHHLKSIIDTEELAYNIASESLNKK